MFGNLARAGARFGLAGLALLIASNALQNAVAKGDSRTLTMHHVHTGETITVTYMRDGKYDETALKKLDWFLRDWRRNEEVRMDPHLFDVLWQVYRETGATKPIEIICGYRSPNTNALLRARSGGVAEFSQHILGKAIDFFIPSVPLTKLRAVGLQLQRGGVGFYPRSGSPFVHLDVGTVRHWPGISREQLVKIFPHGGTVHIPRDGKPLPGFAQALAEIERRGDVPNARSLMLARAAGAIGEREERVAELMAQNHRESLVALVNSGRDNGVAKGKEAPVALASLRSIKHAPTKPLVQVASAAPVPLPHVRPKLLRLASAKSRPAVAPVTTDSAGHIVDQRFWPGPNQDATAPFEVASADMSQTGSIGGYIDALAYASERPSQRQAAPKNVPKPMGQRLRAHLPRLVSPAMADTPVEPQTMEAKSLLGTPMAIGGQRLSSPWTRAAMLTPSVVEAMTVTRLGSGDPRLLRDLLYKPARAVAMNFSNDPQAGMTADRFSGDAVVFLATTPFVPQQTASLQ